MKIYKIIIKAVILVFLLSLGVPSFAILTVTFPSDTNINRIQYYWATESSGANLAGRSINSDPNIVLTLSDASKQAKVGSTPPTNSFVFGSDSSFVNSGTTRIRLWDSASGANNGKYTNLKDYANPSGAPASDVFSLGYSYIKATPGQGQIYQIDETSSYTYPALGKTGKLIFYSRQTARSDGLAVESNTQEWEVTYNNGTPATVNSGTSLTLQTPDYKFNAGDKYKIRVRYKNLWNVWGEFGEALFTVGGGGASYEVTYNLKKYERTKLVVNDISVPMDMKASALEATIEAFSNATDTVYAISKWDLGTGKSVMYIPGSDPSSDYDIKKGEGVQVYVKEDVTITMKNQ